MHIKNYFLFLIVILFVSTNLKAQIDPGTENLTHAWTFDDGTARDTVGDANGVLMGDAKILNGSLQTTSANSWMVMPADTIALNVYKEITIVAWFKSVANGNTGFSMLSSFGDTRNGLGVNYYYITAAREDDVSRAGISCGDESTPWASETFAAGTEYDDGKLHQMVSTIDSANIKLYIDGQLQAATPLDSNNSIAKISSNYAYLAKSVYDGDPTWRGEIPEFDIYNKALSAEEVLYLFNETDVYAAQKPVIVEAESGELGSKLAVMQANNVSYITATENSTLFVPGDSTRVATYQVTFPDSGNYSLYVRLRVGANGFNDDSYLYAMGFGEKNDTAVADWVFNNGLAGAGFSDSSDVVDGPGALGTGVWKWVNASKNTYSGALGDTFYVGLDSLTKTFQIATREDGLDIDKIAFGKSSLFFTVGDLNNGLPGSSKLPAPDTVTGTVWEGPAFAAGMSNFIGSAYGSSDPNFINYWTQLTPENAGKWGSVGTSTDTAQWSWSGLDAAYNYAMNNDLIFKDHCLIWGAQQPTWISALDSAQQYNYIESWIRQVGQRYPNTDMIDVVNEPLNGHNPPDGGNGRANYKNALGGNGATGWDWVIKSFELARKYLPNTKLLLNDYGIINSNSATTSYLQIINLLNDRGLIDGIGVQGHRFALESADTNTLKNNLAKLGATGLPVYITEFDLGNLGDSGTPDDNQQLQLYQKIFPVLWKSPAVKGITFWGYIQGRTWQTTAYLVRSDGTARPALLWLAQYVQDNPTGVTETSSVLPDKYELDQNFPNPFNPSTNIRYSLIKTSKVTLKIYDLLGREVKVLVNTVQSSGQYTVTFDAQDLASGVYFYQINTGSFIATKKLILLK
ncbi:MAG: endo-1,4-beta-xylanase [Ignavibacteriaceae bacterium]